MIYPADWNIRLLQNSSWRALLRATHSARNVTAMTVATGVPTFTTECHGLQAGDRVVFTSANGTPCGLNVNQVYFVAPAGLAVSAFQVSATSGGSPIALTDTADGSYQVAFTVARPVDITGCTLDSDIVDTSTSLQVATFSISVPSAVDGSFELSLSAATTLGLAVGTYAYDFSITSPGGERYYYLKGSVEVERTLSRI